MYILHIRKCCCTNIPALVSHFVGNKVTKFYAKAFEQKCMNKIPYT